MKNGTGTSTLLMSDEFIKKIVQNINTTYRTSFVLVIVSLP